MTTFPIRPLLLLSALALAVTVANDEPLVKATNCADVVQVFKANEVVECFQQGPTLYWRIDKLQSWSKSRKDCQKVEGGDLISIHSMTERILMQHLMQTPFTYKNNYFWIGLYNPNKWNTSKKCLDRYIWSDGSAVDYYYWRGPKQPDCYRTRSNVESCGMVLEKTNLKTGNVWRGWNDLACSKALPALCKANVY